MSPAVNRRQFLNTTAVATTVVGSTLTSQVRAAQSANEKVVIGVMGLSRGRSLAVSFAKQPNVEIKYVCDVDSERADSAAKLIAGAVDKAPQAIGDFRNILDDKSVDALVCAAPNHWHAPATILGVQAGKHVYVEKPCSQNAQEGEWMVAAARKHKRAVQMGSQRRSGTAIAEGIQRVQEGAIGKVYLARAWYHNARGSIGTGKPAPVPSRLNYDLWQGPAPRTPYIDNRVHYNWHWFWHWGNGELGNNGIHSLDICRWGMNAQFPTRVTSSGGRYHHQDDQQTPDTHSVAFEFAGGKQITWQGLSCNRNGSGFVKFYGTNGCLEIIDNGYVIYDPKDKEIDRKTASRGDIEHIDNFLAAIRTDKPLELNSEIAKGHRSTMLCHLGNIAQRTGRALSCNPKNGHIIGDDDAMKLWGRQYDPKWKPTV
ncbi:MAG: Gfo/Idh/MocA family oxidoreductase [Pirellulaceae bacterium]